MQVVLVVGLGEIGSTIYNILRQNNNFKTYGIDLDKTKMQGCNAQKPKSSKSQIDVLHICIPVSNQKKFIEISKSYVQNYKPKLTIINSTVPVGTTVKLYKQVGGLIAHSPCRGVYIKIKNICLKNLHAGPST